MGSAVSVDLCLKIMFSFWILPGYKACSWYFLLCVVGLDVGLLLEGLEVSRLISQLCWLIYVYSYAKRKLLSLISYALIFTYILSTFCGIVHNNYSWCQCQWCAGFKLDHYQLIHWLALELLWGGGGEVFISSVLSLAWGGGGGGGGGVKSGPGDWEGQYFLVSL